VGWIIAIVVVGIFFLMAPFAVYYHMALRGKARTIPTNTATIIVQPSCPPESPTVVVQSSFLSPASVIPYGVPMQQQQQLSHYGNVPASVVPYGFPIQQQQEVPHYEMQPNLQQQDHHDPFVVELQAAPVSFFQMGHAAVPMNALPTQPQPEEVQQEENIVTAQTGSPYYVRT
jgi:hypothetical protein